MTFDNIVAKALQADEAASNYGASIESRTIHAARADALARLAQAVAAKDAADVVRDQLERANASLDKI